MLWKVANEVFDVFQWQVECLDNAWFDLVSNDAASPLLCLCEHSFDDFVLCVDAVVVALL